MMNRLTLHAAIPVAVALALAFLSVSSARAEGVDPEADAVLRGMSEYLSGLAAFRAEVEIENELIDLAGQKLQLSSSGSIALVRSDRLRLTRRTGIADMEILFDGSALSLQSRSKQVYARFEQAGTVDDALRRLSGDLGLDVPAADLLYSDVYEGLREGVLTGAYLGWAYVDGAQCHHLAFREEQVDWQLWVRTGDVPLPVKYVITSKWVAGAPQYSARLRSWDTSPEIPAETFEFQAAEGAKQVESIPVDEAGQLLILEKP
jgi:hypothetical protein